VLFSRNIIKKFHLLKIATCVLCNTWNKIKLIEGLSFYTQRCIYIDPQRCKIEGNLDLIILWECFIYISMDEPILRTLEALTSLLSFPIGNTYGKVVWWLWGVKQIIILTKKEKGVRAKLTYSQAGQHAEYNPVRGGVGLLRPSRHQVVTCPKLRKVVNTVHVQANFLL